MANNINAVKTLHDSDFINLFSCAFSLSTRPFVDMYFNDVPFHNCLYDSGSEATIISPQTLRKIQKHGSGSLQPITLNIRAHAANKALINISHCFKMQCKFEAATCNEFVLVSPDIAEQSIIGINLIRKLSMAYDPVTHTVSNKLKTRYIARTNQKLVLEPLSVTNIKVDIKNDFDEVCPNKTMLLQLCPTDCPTISVCDELISTSSNGASTICVVNVGHLPLTIPKKHIFGSAEIIDESTLRPFDELSKNVIISSLHTVQIKSKNHERSFPEASEADKQWIRENITLSHLSTQEQELFYKVLYEYHFVFSRHRFDIGKSNVYSHKIELLSKQKNWQHQFQSSWAHEDELRKTIKNWLMADIIFELKNDKGEQNTAIFCVPKKADNTGVVSFRTCLDFRFLNSISRMPKFQLPSVQEALDVVSKNRPTLFSSLDITSAFFHIPLQDKQSKEMTSFSYDGKRFGFNVAPFGLHSLPMAFQRMMNKILAPLSPNVLPYQDDILICAQSINEMADNLEKCLKLLAGANLKVNPRKLSIAVKTLRYLGFQINDQGVSISKDNIESISKAKPPRTLYQVRSFLGLTCFFRHLVPHFSQTAAALTALTRKVGNNWKGGPIPKLALRSFNDLKKILTSAPSIAYPNKDPQFKFHLFSDASQHEIDKPTDFNNNVTNPNLRNGSLGFVLTQETSNNQLVPICFGSRNLHKSERNYSSYALELAAAHYAISKCQHWLEPPRSFILHTDNKPIVQSVSKKKEIRTLSRLQALMSRFIFTVQYTKGGPFNPADYSSRFGYCTTVNSVQCFQNWVPEDKLSELQKLDPVGSSLFHFLRTKELPLNPIISQTTKKLAPWAIISNSEILMIKSRTTGKFLFYAPAVMHSDIIAAAHNLAHRKLYYTVARISQIFYVDSVVQQCKDFIEQCLVCQRLSKRKNLAAPMHSTYSNVNNVHERLCIDLYGKLNECRGYSYICVFLDHFSRYCMFVPLQTKSPSEVAQALFDNWVSQHSIPDSILTDFGVEFEGKVISSLYSQLGIEKRRTSSYTPQTNGACESVMKSVTAFLRQCMLELNSDDWVSFLPLLSLTFNTHVSKATGESAFFLMYNKHPNLGLMNAEQNLRHYYGDSYPDILMRRIQRARKMAKECNMKEVDRYKAIYDAKIKPHNLSQNSLCWLYVPGHKKLDILYQGPYVVLRKISDFSYLIQHIHTFQTKTVSSHRLKAYVSNSTLSDKAAAAAAAAAAGTQNESADVTSSRDGQRSDIGNEKKEMHSPLDNRFSDNNDIVVLSHQDTVRSHRPFVLKNEGKNADHTIKREPVSPFSAHSSSDITAEQSSSKQASKSKSPLQRIGSKVFGKRAGFVPDLEEVSEFLTHTPPPSRVTRTLARSKNIEIPPIWPLDPSKK